MPHGFEDSYDVLCDLTYPSLIVTIKSCPNINAISKKSQHCVIRRVVPKGKLISRRADANPRTDADGAEVWLASDDTKNTQQE